MMTGLSNRMKEGDQLMQITCKFTVHIFTVRDLTSLPHGSHLGKDAADRLYVRAPRALIRIILNY